jgi:hypothetical protein
MPLNNFSYFLQEGNTCGCQRRPII